MASGLITNRKTLLKGKLFQMQMTKSKYCPFVAGLRIKPLALELDI